MLYILRVRVHESDSLLRRRGRGRRGMRDWGGAMGGERGNEDESEVEWSRDCSASLFY